MNVRVIVISTKYFNVKHHQAPVAGKILTVTCFGNRILLHWCPVNVQMRMGVKCAYLISARYPIDAVAEKKAQCCICGELGA